MVLVIVFSYQNSVSGSTSDQRRKVHPRQVRFVHMLSLSNSTTPVPSSEPSYIHYKKPPQDQAVAAASSPGKKKGPGTLPKRPSSKSRNQSRNPADEHKGRKPTVFVITPTYSRSTQQPDLLRVSLSLRVTSAKVHWILVEDSKHRTPWVAELLARTGLPNTHLVVTTGTPVWSDENPLGG
jgi:hypothetical protein